MITQVSRITRIRQSRERWERHLRDLVGRAHAALDADELAEAEDLLARAQVTLAAINSWKTFEQAAIAAGQG